MRFSSFSEICAPFVHEIFRKCKSEIFIKWKAPPKLVSVLHANERVSDCCQTRRYIGGHLTDQC